MLLPLNRVFLMGDQLMAASLTEAEDNAPDDWDPNEREYRKFLQLFGNSSF